MKTIITTDEPTIQLSRLVDRAAAAKSSAKPRRLGFLKGEIEVPDDFNRIGEREIAGLFGISS